MQSAHFLTLNFLLSLIPFSFCSSVSFFFFPSFSFFLLPLFVSSFGSFFSLHLVFSSSFFLFFSRILFFHIFFHLYPWLVPLLFPFFFFFSFVFPLFRFSSLLFPLYLLFPLFIYFYLLFYTFFIFHFSFFFPPPALPFFHPHHKSAAGPQCIPTRTKHRSSAHPAKNLRVGILQEAGDLLEEPDAVFLESKEGHHSGVFYRKHMKGDIERRCAHLCFIKG